MTRLLLLLLICLIHTDGLTLSQGQYLTFKYVNGTDIFGTKKKTFSLFLGYDLTSEMYHSFIVSSGNKRKNIEFFGTKTEEGFFDFDTKYPYYNNLFRTEKRVICLTYNRDSSIITVKSLFHNNKPPLSNFLPSTYDRNLEMNIDSLMDAINLNGEETIYKLISFNDTLLLNKQEQDTIRFVYFTAYEDGICDDKADSILTMNLVDRVARPYVKPKGWQPCPNDIELKWKTHNGYIIYLPNTKRFGFLNSGFTNFRTIEKTENGVITFKGIRTNRDGIKVKDVSQWDAKRKLYISYEFWPEVVFYPHAYKIEGDLWKMITDP